MWLAPSKLFYFVGLVRHIKQHIETLLLFDLCVISSNNWSLVVSKDFPPLLCHRSIHLFFLLASSYPLILPYFRAYQSGIRATHSVLSIHLLIFHFLNTSSSPFYLKSGPLPYLSPFFYKKKDLSKKREKNKSLINLTWWWMRNPAGWGEIQPWSG